MLSTQFAASAIVTSLTRLNSGGLASSVGMCPMTATPIDDMAVSNKIAPNRTGLVGFKGSG